jgi:MFS family permease
MRRFAFFSKKSYRALYFLLVLTIIWESADTAFTYVLPVILQERFNDLTLLGIVVSLGAVASICIDLLTGWKFARKHYRFFYITGFIASLMISVLANFPMLIIFTFMSVLGGIYYELFFFGTEDFIAREVDYQDHTKASSMVVLAMTLSALFIPVFISDAINNGEYGSSFWAFNILILIALATFLIYTIGRRHNVEKQDVRVKRISLLVELRVWKLLSKDSGIYLFLLIFMSIQDAFFWTLGAIFAVQYSVVNHYSQLLIPLYMLPGLITGLVAGRLQSKGSKERLSLVLFAISGVILALFYLTDDIPLLLVLTFLSSFFSTLSYNFLDSLFNDFVSRLNEDGNYMLGLRGVASDVAYVIGPIIAGFIAQNVGVRNSFGFIGLLTGILGTAIFLFHPHKVRIEEQKVEELEQVNN